MICPHIVNFSLLLGAILSWGILWPFIESKAGDWYPEGLESTDFNGLLGYKVIIIIPIYAKIADVILLRKSEYTLVTKFIPLKSRFSFACP